MRRKPSIAVRTYRLPGAATGSRLASEFRLRLNGWLLRIGLDWIRTGESVPYGELLFFRQGVNLRSPRKNEFSGCLEWRLRSWIALIGNRPPVVPGLGRLDGSVFVSCFRLAGALEGLGRYAGVCRVDACVRPLPAECLEA